MTNRPKSHDQFRKLHVENTIVTCDIEMHAHCLFTCTLCMKRMYIDAIIFKQRDTSLQRVVSNFQTTIIIQTTIGSSTIMKGIYQTENQTIYWPIAYSLFVMYGFVVNKINTSRSAKKSIWKCNVTCKHNWNEYFWYMYIKI